MHRDIDWHEVGDRLRTKHRVDPVTGCWVWTGHVDCNGTAVFSLHSSVYPAARRSWDLHYPDSPSLFGGCTVRHICKNSACINPEHLYVVRAKTYRGWGVCFKMHRLIEDNTYIWLAANGREIQACKQCRHLRRTL